MIATTEPVIDEVSPDEDDRAAMAVVQGESKGATAHKRKRQHSVVRSNFLCI